MLDWMYVPRFNRNVLMVSQDGPLWFDTAYYSGVEASAWSWNIRFVDADLDGDDDMLVTNGFAFDTMDIDASLKLKSIQKTSRKDARSLYELKKLQPPYNSPNQLFFWKILDFMKKKKKMTLIFQNIYQVWPIYL